MNIIIGIECETYSEVMQHLSVIRQQIKSEFKKQIKEGKCEGDGSGVQPFEANDNNCYGDHEIKLTYDL
jgi:hypothetical protein